ncbi:hypothetical protein EV426DRAFT_577697 [Tirmania nivea]|nr:hypothetical protein EV426DRAFT_577697 [Tirmania nivea]
MSAQSSWLILLPDVVYMFQSPYQILVHFNTFQNFNSVAALDWLSWVMLCQSAILYVACPLLPIFPLLRHFRTMLAKAQDETPFTSPIADARQETNRCHSPDVECAPPTSKENYICCPPTDICALMENSDKEGVFIAFCVRDPRACYPGLFSCASNINSCCPDGYLCDLRTWEYSTYPVCLATLLRSNTSSTSSSITTSSFTIAATTSPPQTTTQPTDIVPGRGRDTASYLNRSALVGSVVGAICGSVLVTLLVVFSVRKYYRRRRAREAGTLIEQPKGEIPQPSGTTDSGPYESGGIEVLEAGGSGLGELPGQGKHPVEPHIWHELPTGMEDSINPQFIQLGDEDRRQPNLQRRHSDNNVRGGIQPQGE